MRRFNGDDPGAQISAANAWAIWEGETISFLLDLEMSAPFRDGRFALALAQLGNLYLTNQAWLREGQLLADAGRL